MAICETHGIDHDDPAEQEKLYKTLQRRYYFFMVMFLAFIGSGLYGTYLLGGLGGFICALSVFGIHFFYHNMGFAGREFIEMKAQRHHKRQQLRLVPPPKDSGNYV